MTCFLDDGTLMSLSLPPITVSDGPLDGEGGGRWMVSGGGRGQRCRSARGSQRVRLTAGGHAGRRQRWQGGADRPGMDRGGG